MADEKAKGKTAKPKAGKPEKDPRSEKADKPKQAATTDRAAAKRDHLGGRPSAGRIGGITLSGQRRGPDHIAGTASTA